MYKPVKGEQGEQGNQGERGKPSKECMCSYRKHGESVRYITSGGKRSLRSDDSFVIVATSDKCTFLLPELEVKEVDCEDYHYYPIVIKVFIKDGMHELSTSAYDGSKINNYIYTCELDKRLLYTAVSTPTGEWIVYPK